MRARLTAAIGVGLGLAGCVGRDLGDGGGGDTQAAGTMGSSGAATTTTSVTAGGDTTGATTVTTTGSGADEGDSVRFDVGPLPDGGEPPIGCDNLLRPPTFLGDSCTLFDEFELYAIAICMPPSVPGTCEEAVEAEIVDAMVECSNGALGDCSVLNSVCGPFIAEDGACCWWGEIGGQCPGRPFVVDGVARVAAIAARDDWQLAAPASAGTGDQALAQAWLFDALHEHAAIASFQRFALQLLAIGAPPRLVEGALRAAADELEHAQHFFGLAAAHGGRGIGPGALDLRDALGDGVDLRAVVLATVREGCIAETISSMWLARAREGAEDPVLRERLSGVPAQELEHVELAWAFVAWALARGDAALRAAVAAEFTDARRWIPCGPPVEPPPEARNRFRAHGRLCADERVAIAAATLHALVWPAANELLQRVRPASDESRKVVG